MKLCAKEYARIDGLTNKIVDHVIHFKLKELAILDNACPLYIGNFYGPVVKTSENILQFSS